MPRRGARCYHAAMRRTTILLVGFTVAAVLALPVTAYVMIFRWHAAWSDPDRDAALAEYYRGHQLADEGRWREAMAKYGAYRDYVLAENGDDSEVQATLADCLWKLGEQDRAIAEYDASLAKQFRWWVAVDRALCVAASDAGAAKQWLERQPFPPQDRTRSLAEFHRRRGEHAEALRYERERIAEAAPAGQFAADGSLLGYDLPLPTERHNALCELAEAMQALAEAEWAVGNTEAAQAAAARALAAHQRIKQSLGYYDEVHERAGSVECRALLARMAIAARRWDEAQAHIALAQSLANRGSYSGHVRLAAAVAGELAAARAGHEPPTRK